MEYILTLTFMTETGKKNSLTISGVKEDVTSEQANALMDNIIANDIFETKNVAYIRKQYPLDNLNYLVDIVFLVIIITMFTLLCTLLFLSLFSYSSYFFITSCVSSIIIPNCSTRQPMFLFKCTNCTITSSFSNHLNTSI